jgi:hypothetical protein
MIDNTWRAQLDRDGTMPRSRRTKIARRRKPPVRLTDSQIRERLNNLGLDGAHSTQAHLDAERALVESRRGSRPKRKPSVRDLLPGDYD